MIRSKRLMIGGIALATAVAAWVNTALLFGRLRALDHLVIDLKLRRRFPRIAVASAIMGVALWAGADVLSPWLDGPALLRIAALVVLVGGGLVFFGGAAFALGAVSRSEFATMLRRPART